MSVVSGKVVNLVSRSGIKLYTRRFSSLNNKTTSNHNNPFENPTGIPPFAPPPVESGFWTKRRKNNAMAVGIAGLVVAIYYRTMSQMLSHVSLMFPRSYPLC
jgi:hypothetical protein